MLRSISFVIEGMVTTQVRVTGNLDGTLSFEFTRLGAGSVGDLGAVFFDLNRPLDGAGFKVFGDLGFSVGAYARRGVDMLGRAAKISHAVVDELGDFDIGIAFGALDPDRGAASRTGFTLAHDTAPLTLDMIDLADFGLRYAWPGVGYGELPGRQESRRGGAERGGTGCAGSDRDPGRARKAACRRQKGRRAGGDRSPRRARHRNRRRGRT